MCWYEQVTEQVDPSFAAVMFIVILAFWIGVTGMKTFYYNVCSSHRCLSRRRNSRKEIPLIIGMASQCIMICNTVIF